MLGVSVIVLANLGLTVHEALSTKPREIIEYKQRIKIRGETFDINRFYDSIRRLHIIGPRIVN